MVVRSLSSKGKKFLSCDYFEGRNLVSQLFTIHQVAFEAEFD